LDFRTGACTGGSSEKTCKKGAKSQNISFSKDVPAKKLFFSSTLLGYTHI
jgi:hypothetical protein